MAASGLRRLVNGWLAALLLATAALPAQTSTPTPAPAPTPAPPAPAFSVEDDLQYAEGFSADARRNRLDLYLPQRAADAPLLPLVMFVHGGAWIGGSKEQHRHVGRAIARQGVACAVINYRLTPMVQHPAHVQDCARALVFLHGIARRHGCDPDRIFLMGHSAGGHLISLLSLDPSWLQQAGAQKGLVKGCIPLSGPMDVRPPLFAFDGIFGRDPEVRAKASPLTLPDRATAAALPPMFLLWAQRDMAGLGEQNEQMVARLREVGAPFRHQVLPGEGHVSYLLRIGTPRDVVTGPALAFVRERCETLAKRPAPAGTTGR